MKSKCPKNYWGILFPYKGCGLKIGCPNSKPGNNLNFYFTSKKRMMKHYPSQLLHSTKLVTNSFETL